MTAPTRGSTVGTFAAPVNIDAASGPSANWPVPIRREVAGMRAEWQLVNDVDGGTPTVRANSAAYLPRFEAEHVKDYAARLKMTFIENQYRRSLDELVGLAMTHDPKLNDDVPEAIVTQMENVTGEGEHLDIFVRRAMRTGMHYGHAALLTDFPRTQAPDAPRLNMREAARMNLRPYTRLVPACDILTWDVTSFGGVNVLTCVAFAEWYDDASTSKQQVRQYEQAVIRDVVSATATALGDITYTLWRLESTARGPAEWVVKDTGIIDGPPTIPFRVFYGGERTAPLVTRPYCIDLAYTNIEHAQVTSDYAAVMHKCNVPTPVFTGLRLKEGEQVNLGIGLQLEDNGTAMMLEPSGAALNATRMRLEDLRAEMRRQGAALPDGTGKVMTAQEAALYARQRNARLAVASRSLQDACEAMLQDFASFQKLPSGGGITLSRDFSSSIHDTGYLTVLKDATDAGFLPVDAFLYALVNGKLPDDFEPVGAALAMMAEQEAQAKLDAQQALDFARATPPAPDMTTIPVT